MCYLTTSCSRGFCLWFGCIVTMEMQSRDYYYHFQTYLPTRSSGLLRPRNIKSNRYGLSKSWIILKRKNYGKWKLCCIVLMLHPALKIMPFKLTGYCRMRSKNGKFKPRRRRNVWLYSVKWSHLNKDKRDCRTFQLIKQFAHS